MKKMTRLVVGIATLFSTAGGSLAAEKVAIDSFVRAESDEVFSRYVKQGAFGKFTHEREPAAINKLNVVPEKNDGSITINFGKGADAVNNLPVTPGWNYIVRMYQPRTEILDGSWKSPRAQPAQQ